MTMQEIKRMFIESHYGSMAAYRKARKEDYFAVQEEWSFYIDGLCRDGVITQKQYYNATF